MNESRSSWLPFILTAALLVTVPWPGRADGDVISLRPQSAKGKPLKSSQAVADLHENISQGKSLDATGFFRAVKANDLEWMQDIVDRKGPEIVNARIRNSVTPLHLAAALDYREAVGYLIARGAQLDAATDSGFTPVHWAAGRNAITALGLVLDAGASINAQTETGITPLHWAAAKNATDAVLLLVKRGANVELKTRSGLTPLHWAVKHGADEAKLTLAFKQVSDNMDAGIPVDTDTARRILKGDLLLDATPPDTGAAAGDALPPVAVVRPQTTPVAVPGKSLIVPLGFGENLTFVWVEVLDMWIGKYEVANGQFRRFRPAHKSLFFEEFSLDGADQPVVYVSWHDAKAYCDWLNENFADRLPKGFEFRLPSSTEWMTVARCGDERSHPWGDRWPPLYGNFADRAAKPHIPAWVGISNYDDTYVVTCPVTQSGSNEWGIFGLAGNAWEWCEDWLDAAQKHKVRHGGGWSYTTEIDTRVMTRGMDRPETRFDTIGFRVVVALKRD